MIEYCYKADNDDYRYIYTDRELNEDIAAFIRIPEAIGDSGVRLPVGTRDSRNERFLKGPPVTNAKVYILGDKYDMPTLKNFTIRMYREVAENERNLLSFAGSAELVYENTPAKKDRLRSFILKLHMEKLASLVVCQNFLDLLSRKPEITLDIFRRLAEMKMERRVALGLGDALPAEMIVINADSIPQISFMSPNQQIARSVLSGSTAPRSPVASLRGSTILSPTLLELAVPRIS
jgi:hypothetical protein